MFAGRSAARQAQVSFWTQFRCALSQIPTTLEFTIQQHLFQVLLRERLRLPLFLTESTCSGPLDPLGHHRAACSQSGRIQSRATPIERVMARIYREAGPSHVQPSQRYDRIEVFAQDLPCFGRSQLAVDVTLRSVLTRSSGR